MCRQKVCCIYHKVYSVLNKYSTVDWLSVINGMEYGLGFSQSQSQLKHRLVLMLYENTALGRCLKTNTALSFTSCCIYLLQ